MTAIDRIAPMPAAGMLPATSSAATVAHGAMATIGDRILAWSAQNFGGGQAAARWTAQVGGGSGFAPDHAELRGGGDVYELRALTADVAAKFSASPAEEGALGRAIDGFARAVALRFNAVAGSSAEPLIDDVAAALQAASSSGPGGIDGVTARIETATRIVDAANR